MADSLLHLGVHRDVGEGVPGSGDARREQFRPEPVRADHRVGAAPLLLQRDAPVWCDAADRVRRRRVRGDLALFRAPIHVELGIHQVADHGVRTQAERLLREGPIDHGAGQRRHARRRRGVRPPPDGGGVPEIAHRRVVIEGKPVHEADAAGRPGEAQVDVVDADGPVLPRIGDLREEADPRAELAGDEDAELLGERDGAVLHPGHVVRQVRQRRLQHSRHQGNRRELERGAVRRVPLLDGGLCRQRVAVQLECAAERGEGQELIMTGTACQARLAREARHPQVQHAEGFRASFGDVGPGESGEVDGARGEW